MGLRRQIIWIKKELVIVTVSYSFDAEVVAIIFDDYKKASEYIKKDFENEKKIDEESTYCEENIAVLSTIYNGETETTTWTLLQGWLITDKIGIQ